MSTTQRVSTSLTESEESLLSGIAINPELTIKELSERYDKEPMKMNRLAKDLEEKGLLLPLMDDDLKWEVTNLGQLYMLRYMMVSRFEAVEARMRGEDGSQFEQRRRVYEKAYKNSRELFRG